MPELSLEDKAKGKRIIIQFFRTMPSVQKSLMTAFERNGYKGVFRIQHLLYPDSSSEINSTDTLRKSLSMILQHIYGMPVEDKEGYFQDILKCKTASQVVRKEKETLVNHFYGEFPTLRDYLLAELIEDPDFQFMNMLRQKFLQDVARIADMRSFKNQIRNLRETLAEQLSGGTQEDELVSAIQEYSQTYQEEAASVSQAAAEASPAGNETTDLGEKRQIILNIFSDAKYHDLRDFLLQTATADSNFAIFQQYLDNISAPSSRLIASDLTSFEEGVKKVKSFRDSLEQKLLG